MTNGERLFFFYAGAVAFSFFPLIYGVGFAKFIYDYQALIIGVPGGIAVVTGFASLRRERHRHVVNIILGYEPELEMLDELDALTKMVAEHSYPSVVASLLGRRSGGHQLSSELPAELRTRKSAVRGSISMAIETLAFDVEEFNRLVAEADSGSGPLPQSSARLIESYFLLTRENAGKVSDLVHDRRATIMTKIDLYDPA